MHGKDTQRGQQKWPDETRNEANKNGPDETGKEANKHGPETATTKGVWSLHLLEIWIFFKTQESARFVL